MNSDGDIRILGPDGQYASGEIGILDREAKLLETLSKKARKAFHQAITQGLSRDAAMACAQAEERRLGRAMPSKKLVVRRRRPHLVDDE